MRGSRFGRSVKKRKRAAQRFSLRVRIEGFASGMSQRKVTEPEPRHTGIFDNVFGASHDHCGDAVLFKVAGDQTDRLMAHRSCGHQQRDLGRQCAADRQCVRRVLFRRYALTSVGWNADQLIVELANNAVLFGLL